MRRAGTLGAVLLCVCILASGCGQKSVPPLAPPAAEPSPTPGPTAAPDRETPLRQAVRDAMDACVTEDMTDLEKLTALHDWLCLRCEYGMTPERESAYGALVEGLAVCRGYAAGYARLAQAAGLEGAYTYSEEADHAWILATLDGDRYFSDATWDDGKGPCLGLIRHDCFLFDEASADGTGHTGWDGSEPVPGGPLEAAPWTGAVTRVIFQPGQCWYVDRTFTLCRCDRDSWETETLFTLPDRWPAADQEGKVYATPYTSLIWLEGRLWFNTPYELRSVLPDGTDMRTELAPDVGDRWIYGLGVRDGKLCYALSDAPDAVLFDVIETDIDAAGAWGCGPGL